MLGVEVALYQPSRFIEGYGIHVSSIDKALEDNVKLLITVDCGITNLEAAAYAKTKGVDLIITDLSMPTNGEVVVQTLHRKGIETPLIVLTGYVTEEKAQYLVGGICSNINK